jgi:hypothetical protein
VEHSVRVRCDGAWKSQRFGDSPGLRYGELDSGRTKLLLRELYVALFTFVFFAFLRMRPGFLAFVTMPGVVILTT